MPHIDLYVGQVPVQPLLITVPGVDLSVYDSFTVLLTSPEGDPIPTSSGVTSQPEPGKVRYLWPLTSLFPEPGEYALRLKLTKSGASDYTEQGSINVYREG